MQPYRLMCRVGSRCFLSKVLMLVLINGTVPACGGSRPKDWICFTWGTPCSRRHINLCACTSTLPTTISTWTRNCQVIIPCSKLLIHWKRCWWEWGVHGAPGSMSPLTKAWLLTWVMWLRLYKTCPWNQYLCKTWHKRLHMLCDVLFRPFFLLIKST